MASVRLQSVSKKFGETVVVDDVTLAIDDREFLVLVGPSGCGKSTTLRMIAGLETASGGDIFIGDRRVNDVGPKDRDIAMVFQNYALYPHMNVYENMAFGLRMRGQSRDEIDRRVKEAAEILGLGPAAETQAEGDVRRTAPARGSRPRDRAASCGVPDGRAALEPRREAARADARRDREAAPARRDDDDLRHARSSRGDDDGPPHRRHEGRRRAASRHAQSDLRQPRQPVRRGVHRLADDELLAVQHRRERRRDVRARRRIRRPHPATNGAPPSRRPTSRTPCSAFGPKM